MLDDLGIGHLQTCADIVHGKRQSRLVWKSLAGEIGTNVPKP
jgi:hypothetical protein